MKEFCISSDLASIFLFDLLFINICKGFYILFYYFIIKIKNLKINFD